MTDIDSLRAAFEEEYGLEPEFERVEALRTAPDLAGHIDHTILAADATRADVERICAEAREHDFASVCVNSRWVPLVNSLLVGSDVMTCSVVGFPLGAMSTEAKAAEAWAVARDGADEIDMVIDIGDLKAGELSSVLSDIEGVVEAADGVPVKVIIETCLLTDDEKVLACLLAMRGGASYVKTSTGFSKAGATVADVALMRRVVGEELGVKASGGIRTYDDAVAMLEAGADRIGASASVAIVGAAPTEFTSY